MFDFPQKSFGYDLASRAKMVKSRPTTKKGQQNKVHKVMHEFKHGQLHSSSGDPVTKRKQAVAIAMSESGQSWKSKKKGGKKKSKKSCM